MEIKYNDFFIISMEDKYKKDEILELVEKIEEFACVDSMNITIKQEDANRLLLNKLLDLGVINLYAKILRQQNDYLIQDSKIVKEIYKY